MTDYKPRFRIAEMKDGGVRVERHSLQFFSLSINSYDVWTAEDEAHTVDDIVEGRTWWGGKTYTREKINKLRAINFVTIPAAKKYIDAQIAEWERDVAPETYAKTTEYPPVPKKRKARKTVTKKVVAK